MRILIVAAGAIGGDFGARCPPPDATLCSGAAAARCKAGEDRTGRQKPKRPSCLAATAYRGNRAIRVPFDLVAAMESFAPAVGPSCRRTMGWPFGRSPPRSTGPFRPSAWLRIPVRHLRRWSARNPVRASRKSRESVEVDMTVPLPERCADRLSGVLSCYDRIVVTGTLPTGVRSHIRKEAVVAKVLERRSNRPGLVHVISAMEACSAYKPWQGPTAGSWLPMPISCRAATMAPTQNEPSATACRMNAW